MFKGKVLIGNGAPWNCKVRSLDGGDNLFLCSIVALDPDTGDYKWHYQTTPGETWDFNSNMDIVLADAGAGEYGRCVVCHGFDAISPGMAPDLRASPLVSWDEAFAEIVRDGARQPNGMPRFRHLSDEQLLKIRHYVRREAEKALED